MPSIAGRAHSFYDYCAERLAIADGKIDVDRCRTAGPWNSGVVRDVPLDEVRVDTYISGPQNKVVAGILSCGAVPYVETCANTRLVESAPDMRTVMQSAGQAIRASLTHLPADDEGTFAGEWLDEINEVTARLRGCSHTPAPWSRDAVHAVPPGSVDKHSYISGPKHEWIAATLGDGDMGHVERCANDQLIKEVPAMWEMLKGAQKVLRMAMPFMPSGEASVVVGKSRDEVDALITRIEDGH